MVLFVLVDKESNLLCKHRGTMFLSSNSNNSDRLMSRRRKTDAVNNLRQLRNSFDSKYSFNKDCWKKRGFNPYDLEVKAIDLVAKIIE